MTLQNTQWQDRLDAACRQWQIPGPVWQIVSDRRGGRTAWSSRVIVHGQVHQARFWYDGKNAENAREDAAEVALRAMAWLNGPNVGMPPPPAPPPPPAAGPSNAGFWQ